MPAPEPGPADELFVVHRRLLFTVAYEMLGSAADAEDVVQETWLRWNGIGAGAQAEVQDARAYLVRIVTRQALNRLRTVARQREDYVGEWLPEPLLTSPDVAEDVEFAENVSIAMLTVLETLRPAERAVFVLREVFDAPYDEIAEAVGRSEPAVRQIAHRARAHVAARRPRIEVSRTQQQQVVDRFLAALVTGDVQGLMDVLAPDVVMIPDSGGLVQAARRPITGAERLVRFLAGLRSRTPTWIVATGMWLNGGPGARIDVGGQTTAAISLTIANGRITQLHVILNPNKLARLEAEAVLVR